MARKANLGLAVLALGALIAATGGSAAGDKATPKLLEAQFARVTGTPIGGLVVATHRPNGRRVQAHVSLHGLPATSGASNRYLVVADTRSCSQVVDAADYVVWRTILIANTEGDFLDKSSPKLLRAFKSARTIRVYDRSGGGQQRQVACGPAQRWATFPSD